MGAIISRKVKHGKRKSFKHFFIFLLVVLFVSTMGLYRDATALFTDQEDIAATYSTATVSIDVDKPIGVNLDVSGLVPGDKVSRELIIKNDGSAAFSYYVYLTYPTSTTPSLLWTGSHGLQFQITDDGGGNSIETTTRVNNIGQASPIALGNLNAGVTETIEFEIILPTLADNTYQNLSQDIVLVFYAEQLTGTDK